MSTKAWVTLCVLIGSVIGGYAPTFFGIGAFSLTSLLTSSIGGIVGIWVGLKLGN